MTLKQFLQLTGMTAYRFYIESGISQQDISRYLSGRIPRPAAMARIVAATKGAVQPNDFYSAPAVSSQAGSGGNSAVSADQTAAPAAFSSKE